VIFINATKMLSASIIIDVDNIPQSMNDEQPISVVSQSVVLNIPTDIQTMLEELSPIQNERVNYAIIRRNPHSS